MAPMGGSLTRRFDRGGKRIESTVFPPGTSRPMQSRYVYRTGGDGSLAAERGSCAAYYIYDYSPEGHVMQDSLS